MVEFIRSVNPGASPVANLSNRYFRPQLDDRESRALGQLANAMARKRGALGGLADSYGALGSKFQQLSNAATSYQQDRLRDLQRQYDTQNRRDQLALDQEQNQFRVAAEKQRLMLAEAGIVSGNANDAADMALQFGDAALMIVDQNVMTPFNNARAGNPPVTDDPSAGGVTFVGSDATGFGDRFGAQLQQAASITGADITVSDATHAGSTQFAALGEQVGADTSANLSLNNPGFVNWIGGADSETQQKAFDIFGSGIVSDGTGLPNLDGVTRAVPKFRSMEDGIRYMGFWAQHRGVGAGTVEQAVRQWFGVSAKGPVVAAGSVSQETVDAYNLRMQIMADNGLQPDTLLDARDARDAFVRGTMRGEISGNNSEAILAAVPDMPLGKLFEEGQQAYQTGRLVRNNAKQYKLFDGSRDEYGPMQAGERRISLDFNSSEGKSDGFYSLVVIPNKATGEERQAASAYSKGMVSLMARYGYDDYGMYGSDGVATREQMGNGKPGTFHTEPFFAQDPRAIALLENPEFMQEYAALVEDTLGQIPGAVIMAPHEAGDAGAEMTLANGQQISERDFALQRLMPLFGTKQRPANDVNITASTQDGPLLLAGSDEKGLTVAQALAGLGIPVNMGSAQDIQSVGASADGVASLDGITTEGLDARASALETAEQALAGEFRDRFQLAVAQVSQAGIENPVQFVMQRPTFRTALSAYYKNLEGLTTAHQQQVIKDHKNSVAAMLQERTPRALDELGQMTDEDFLRTKAAIPDQNKATAGVILALMSDNPDEKAEILRLYPGAALYETDIGKAVVQRGNKAPGNERERAEVDNATVALDATLAARTPPSQLLDSGYDPVPVGKAVEAKVEDTKISINRFSADPANFNIADARSLAAELDELRAIADDSRFVGELNPSVAKDIADAVKAGVGVQEPLAQNMAQELIGLAATPDGALAAYTESAQFGQSLGLARDATDNQNFFNETGEAAAAKYNELTETQLRTSFQPIPAFRKEAAFNAATNSIQLMSVSTEVGEIQAFQSRAIASSFSAIDDPAERAAIVQQATQLGLAGVGTQIMQAQFGQDTGVDLPQLRLDYDETMRAMVEGGADPLTFFAAEDGLNMLVAMQMGDGRAPHEVLRDVQEKISTMPASYVNYVDSVNLAGTPVALRNNVKASLLVDAVTTLGTAAEKESVVKRMEKTLSGLVKTKKHRSNLANLGSLPVTFDQTGKGETGLSITSVNLADSEMVRDDTAQFFAASLVQHTGDVLEDYNAERGPIQAREDILGGKFNVTIEMGLAYLTRGRFGDKPVQEIAGDAVGLISNDRAKVSMQPATFVMEMQDAVTGQITKQEQRAVFLNSETFLDLSAVGTVPVTVIGSSGETDKREVSVSELIPVMTSSGAAYIKTRRTDAPRSVPESSATVGYVYVLPEDVFEVVPGDTLIDNIPLSANPQGAVGIDTRPLQQALQAYNENSFEVRIDG